MSRRSSERKRARGAGAVAGLGRELPPELDFIASHGDFRERLLNAIEDASSGVSPLDAALADGLIEEEAYYRALASHLGCDFYRGEPPFARHVDAPKSLRSGVAPLEATEGGARAAIAPRADGVRGLIAMTASGRLRGENFAVTSPQRFASLLRTQFPAAILDDALGRLPGNLSARRGMNRAQFATVGLLATWAVVIGVGNLRGLGVLAWGALSLTFLLCIAFRSFAAVADGAKPRPRTLSDNELPLYTVVVALYREEDVVADLVRSLEAFDYPKGKLDIKLVVERRDHQTLNRLLALRLPARYEIIVAPPGMPSTKPRALNIALAAARGDLLVVYDAEDAPAPDQLRLAASRFVHDNELDCLQARLTIRNTDASWLSRAFGLEYAVLFDLINPGLCAMNWPIALGGTSNHFRIPALLAAGGWDEWNVAEDADLGIRLARCGYRIGALDSDTTEEAPHELKNFFWQRVRWQKGWMQTGIVHTRHPLRLLSDLGARKTAAAAILVFGSIFSALFWPIFSLDLLWRAFSSHDGLPPWREASDVFTYLVAFAGVWSIFVPVAVAARQRDLRLTAATVALLPVYYVLVSAAAWVAIFDLALRPHFWAKTAHGRGRPVELPRAAEAKRLSSLT